jgi:hypothetical protein
MHSLHLLQHSTQADWFYIGAEAFFGLAKILSASTAMAPGARRVKRESTMAFGGLNTPDESLYSAGTSTPKREEIDLSSVSDVLEDSFQGNSFNQHHGLPAEDEGYSSIVAEQQRRSLSGKFL